MRKSMFIIVFFLLNSFVYSEKVFLFDGCYIYKNTNGSLDWDTFYNDWDISARRFTYIHHKVNHAHSGENFSYLLLSIEDRGDYVYSYYDSKTKLEYCAIFSNYTTAPNMHPSMPINTFQRFTISSEYSKFIQLWNRYFE
ncbi:MAG: hypothetical protein LBI03_08630 [Clostridiales bacterium]|jgi:hypothetical protein|nr:hypothetical protein [Clostridiales bacterium]